MNFFSGGGQHLKIWRISIKNMGVLASLVKIRNSGKTGSAFPLGDPQLELIGAALFSEDQWPSLTGYVVPVGPIITQSAAFVNLVIVPPTHTSTFPSMSLKACTFSTLGRSHRERRGQCYPGLGKGLEGEVSFELGQERSTCVHQEGTRGGGEEGERQPGQKPRQKQGREEQPGLGLPVLLCLALAALMGLLTQDGPSSASDLWDLPQAGENNATGDTDHTV